MKVLVIGGTGPTGPHIVQKLIEHGHHVIILHRGTHETEMAGGVEHIHADPYTLGSLEQALDHRNFDIIISTYGRLRITAEAAKGRTERFIGIGAGAYLGSMRPEDNPDGLEFPIPEEAPLYIDPNVNQFLAKVTASEQAVMKAHEEGYYQATMLRYPRWVYGPRCLIPLEWSIIKRIIDGRKHIIVSGDGLTLLSRGYAENLAGGVVLAAESIHAKGQIYNLADEHPFTQFEWITRIARFMNAQIEIVSIPWDVAKPAYPYSLIGHHVVFDLSKVKKELGYKDVVSSEKGLETTVRWIINNQRIVLELEKNIGDLFLYSNEAAMINIYENSRAALSSLSVSEFERPKHAYSKERS